MAYFKIVDEAADLKADYDFISNSYSNMARMKVATPQGYFPSSLIPAYCAEETS